MKIGEVAARAGVSVDTVRYYERRGVLPLAARRPSGYRIYDEGAVERIQLVRRLKRLGFTLDEIRDALRAADGGQATCASERWRLDAALARIDRKLAELRAVRREITGTMTACDEGGCVLAETS